MYASNNILGFTAGAALIGGLALMAAVMLITSDPRPQTAPPGIPDPEPGINSAFPGVPPLDVPWFGAPGGSPDPGNKPEAGAMPEPGMRPSDGTGIPAEPPVDLMPPPEAAFTPAAVVHKDFELRATERDKELALRVYYPQNIGEKPLPVIVFSHGMGGSREVGQDLMEFWASYGYAVICPTHEDSIKLRREAGESVDPTTMLIEFGLKDERRVSRVKDDMFILDALAEIERKAPALAGKLDAERVGIGGHSAGAMTSMLLAGAKNDLPSGEKQHNFRDKRFDCALVLSGQGVGGSGFIESSWSRITIPMMVMTGSEDYAITKTDPQRRCDPYTFAPEGGKYLLFFEGAVHSSFTGQAAALSRTEEQIAIFIAAQEASLAFWEAYLKGDQRALDWLNSDEPTKHFTKALHYSYK